MFLFWILAALMSAIAIAFVIVPLLRPRTVEGPSAQEAALEVLRGQRREIEADIAAGQLPAAAREEAMAELVERAHEDLGAGVTRPEARAGKPWPLAVAAGILVPALAFGLYAALGTPSASDPKTLAAAHSPADDKQILEMVENLARKVRERPEDAQGWALLARSMAAMGRFPEAAQAYEHLSRLVPRDAQVLADWADSLGMAQGRTLKGRPGELALQALEVDPKHAKALALAATAALEREDYAGAIGFWERLRAVLEPGSQDATQVAQILDEVRGRAAAAGRPVPGGGPGPRVAAVTAPSKAPPKVATLTGSVSVDPAMAARLSGDETLFVYARAEGGPRMPLALARTRAGSLPYAFALDDTQAMTPGANISSAEALRVEARISRSGNATPQTGDLVGTSAVVRPGARDVKIVIDKVLP